MKRYQASKIEQNYLANVIKTNNIGFKNIKNQFFCLMSRQINRKKIDKGIKIYSISQIIGLLLIYNFSLTNT